MVPMLVKMMMMMVNMGSPLVAAQLVLLLVGEAVVVGPLVAGLGFLFLSTVILAVA